MMQQEMPLVTVVITTHNRANMVGRAIRSVLDQTYQNFELIVADDCSTDDTAAVVADFQDSRIRYIRHDRNRGGAAARNTGTRVSQSEYVAFLDDDDVWKPDKIEKQVALANERSSEYAVIYCGAMAVTGEGKKIGESKPRLRGDIRSEMLKKGLNTVPSSHLFRREALEAMGGYGETLPAHNEHDIWMEMARRGYAADYVDEPLVIAYQHQGYQMTKDVGLRIRATEMFVEKWLPEWEKWFGVAVADEYFSQWYARVLMNQGMNCIDRGQLLAAARCYWYIIRRDPGRIRSYVDPPVYFAKVLISRTRFYHPLRRLWRMIRRSQYDTV